MTHLKIGQTVQYKNPTDRREAEARMVLIEDNGDRGIVRLVCDLPIAPTFVVRADEIELVSNSKSPSPEETGNYLCPKCGNRSTFTGYDAHGYPGDECECGEDPCVCEVELVQPFFINSAGEPAYDAHRGGGCGAEIGSYTKIVCDQCGTIIWEE